MICYCILTVHLSVRIDLFGYPLPGGVVCLFHQVER